MLTSCSLFQTTEPEGSAVFLTPSSWPPYISRLLKYQGTNDMWHQWKTRSWGQHFWQIFCYYILCKSSRWMNWAANSTSPRFWILLYVWGLISARLFGSPYAIRGFLLSPALYVEEFQSISHPLQVTPSGSDTRQGEACGEAKAGSRSLCCNWVSLGVWDW